jgi:hypothetical protein
MLGFGEGGSGAYTADIHTHPDAELFLLVGNPDAIAGIESLIQAAEQLAAEEDAILDTRLTPQQRVEQLEVRAAAKAESWAKEKARLEAEYEAQYAAEEKARLEAEDAAEAKTQENAVKE